MDTGVSIISLSTVNLGRDNPRSRVWERYYD